MDYKLYLPDNPFLKNGCFVIYCDDELKKFSKDTMEYLSLFRKNILFFFDVPSFRKVQVNLFFNKEIFLEFTKQFFEPNSYCVGHFANGMINVNVDSSVLIDSQKYNHRIKCIIHEFVHLIYKECVQEKGENKRVVWLDEGLATFLSNQRSGLNDFETFRRWYLRSIISENKIIPKISFLENHGDKYGMFVDNETNKYNGYDLSYLIVRYMIETMNREDILKTINSKEKIDKLGTNILEKTIDYYNKKLNIDSNYHQKSK